MSGTCLSRRLTPAKAAAATSPNITGIVANTDSSIIYNSDSKLREPPIW